nr:transmembrane and TPR repeat-containing protein 1-like [Leptinotarsa decemlineata]
MLLLAAGCMKTIIRNREWRSRESLLRAGLMTLPHNAKMHYNYANFLRDSARSELAKAHYYKALKLWPTYASAHNNLGTLLDNKQEAEQHFLAAIRCSSDHVNAHFNLGQLYRKNNRSSESELMLEKCIQLEPRFTPAYIELVKLRGPSDRSVYQLLKKVVEINPTDPYYSTNFGHWLVKEGRYQDGITHYWKSLQISPSHQEALIGAAKILRRIGQSSRLFQLTTRWQVIKRDSKGQLLLGLHLYLQGWQLKSELITKARNYNVDLHNNMNNITPCSKKNSTTQDRGSKMGPKNYSIDSSTRPYEVQVRKQKSTNPAPTPLMMHHLLDSV